ncbi:MAG: hypothetical protein GY816_22510 [Cytophagales bacterium]|nr:hypothetical protein [Cytophagales bacterium]
MKPVYWLSLLYVVVGVCLFTIYGIKYVNDSHRYLEYANNLRSGFYFEKHNFWYIGYVLFIYIVTTIHDSYEVIVLAQYTYGLIAVWCLFKSGIRLFKSEMMATVSALLFILFIEITTWHSYLLAESFLTSSVCISIYFLSRLLGGDKTPWIIVGCVIIVLLTAFAKPTGFAIIVSIGVVFSVRWLKKINQTIVRWIAGIVPLLLIGVLANNILSTFNVVGHYLSGEVVFASSKQPEAMTHESLFISVPEDLYVPTKDNGAVVEIASFLWMNPMYSAELFFKKMFYFVFHIRPYWSIWHNIFSLVFLVPLYVSLVRVGIRVKLKSDATIFAFVFLLLNVILISATSVDWDGRFLMPILPVVFLIGAKELVQLIISKKPDSVS